MRKVATTFTDIIGGGFQLSGTFLWTPLERMVAVEQIMRAICNLNSTKLQLNSYIESVFPNGNEVF